MSTEPDFHAQLLGAIDAWRQAWPEHTRADAGPASQAAFAVYANTGLKASMDALAANFPSVLNSLGPEEFYALARRYVLAHPARDARLFLYGEAFADFLPDRLATELARLDRLWTLAHVAADAAPLDALRWAEQAGAGLADTCLVLAPACAWHQHADLALAALWPAARESAFDAASAGVLLQDGSAAPAVLITRPGDAVLTHPIDAATCLFLDACAQGLALGQVMQQVLHQYPTTNLQALLATLFGQGAFVDPSSPSSPIPSTSILPET